MSFEEAIARTKSERNMLSGNLDLSGIEAYARDVQDYIHDIRLFDRFDGWSNQLRDDPEIILIYERKWRREPWTKLLGELEFDVVSRINGSIGNVLSHVTLGGAVRYGYNIPRDFGPSNLIKGMRTMDAERTGGKFSLYAFGDAEGRYVAHNTSWMANTRRSSRGVPRKPLVDDLSFSLAVETCGVKFAYTSVPRSREFEGQAGNALFGSVNQPWQLAF